MRSPSHPAYTLVELLTALALSLLLLLGIAELFQRVGGTMNETRSIMSASAHINEAAMLLRQDLGGIHDSLAVKPNRIMNDHPEDDSHGYLEIIEGPYHAFDPDHRHPGLCHPYIDSDENGTPLDKTVGDVDDIIAFTATNRNVPFRGLIRGEIVERESAEIVWFVRGNTLYRRIRLIDDVTIEANRNQVFYEPAQDNFPSKKDLDTHYPTPAEEGQFAIVEADETSDGGPQRYDAVRKGEGLVWTTLLTFEDLARRARRFGHDGIGNNDAGLSTNTFPYPIYNGNDAGWQYLRMPTVEESDYWSGKGFPYWKTASTVPKTPTVNNPDLWNEPYFFSADLLERKSGSLNECLNECIENPRNPRTGEDVVLTNVLSFDVKVWDPRSENFVDIGIGTPGSTMWAGLGRYPDELPRTWDSWTQKYKDMGQPSYWSTELKGIQITIRCFEPASQIIKQVTVVRRFNN